MPAAKHFSRLISQEHTNRFLDDLDKESDRGSVLSASCMLELQIERCMEGLLAKGTKKVVTNLLRPDGPLGTFSARADLLYCLDGISEFEHRAINLVRKIRNKFAHDLLASFSDPRVSDLSLEFVKHVLAEIEPVTLNKLIELGPRKRFTAAVFVLSDMLKLRPMLVSDLSDTLGNDISGLERELRDYIENSEDST